MSTVSDTLPLHSPRRLALFAYGLRPFFLASGVAAVILVPWWAASHALGVRLATDWPPTLWHGHEMLFGFMAAAIVWTYAPILLRPRVDGRPG